MWDLFNKKNDSPASRIMTAEKPPLSASVLNAASEGGQSADVQNALIEMETHLYGWLLDTTPEQIGRTSAHQDAVLSELETRLNKGILQEFPRQPVALPRMLQALAEDNLQPDQLARIIRENPALNDHLIHLSNSHYFTRTDTVVESVEQAIAALGSDGIRGVMAAALLRPLMLARSSQEALFAQRAWRWGVTCSKAVELIARLQGRDTMAHAMVGLLPTLSYLVVRREIVRIYRRLLPEVEPEVSVICSALKSPEWTVAQMIAREWDLPPRYHAHLMAGERPLPNSRETPLNDGMIIGTREVLRQARQSNLSDEILSRAVSLDNQQMRLIQDGVLNMLS